MIEPGRTLLHYRVVDKLGEGGMGVVWRAIDTVLDRQVAIKVLPEAVSDDPARLARFEREARLLASLDHPGIAVVHGLHEDGGLRFLAMELVEGEDLAARLSRGPLPPDEALDVASQVAEALEAAHASGVVHRDLKPANVRLARDGRVKVLDFGLARVAGPDAGADPALSPTLTSAGSAAGPILGTAAYMSPEQARGKPVDRRADLWAFGCLLYECLTARRAFGGETISEILAEVLKGEPDWDALPATVPQAVRRLLRRCLARDPGLRLRDAGDARLELREAALAESDAVPDAAANDRVRAARHAGLAAGLAAGAVLGLVAGGGLVSSWLERRPAAPAAARSIRAELALAEEARLAFGAAPIGYDSPLLALSPDGRWLVWVGRDGESTRLYRRDLVEGGAGEAIAGTEGALYAFFAPGGEAVGFLTFDKLKRVSPGGDDLRTLADVDLATRASWTEDGTIWLAELEARQISRVPGEGGAVERVLALERWKLSEVLPDGGGALLVSKRRGISGDHAEVGWLDLETGKIHALFDDGYDPRYLPSGHVLFARGGHLLALPFDRRRLEVAGEAATVVRGVATDSLFDQAQVAVSRAGLLTYVPGGDRALGRIAWVEGDGKRGVLPVEPRVYGALDLDPADRRLAVHVGGVRDSIRIFDLERGDEQALPSDGRDGWPRWSASGEALAYSSRDEAGDTVLRVRRIGSGGEAREILRAQGYAAARAWSPDDRSLIVQRESGFTVLDIEAGTESESVAGGLPDFSPDGSWIVYSASVGGVTETLARSWPGGEVVHRIGDGIEPRWSPCGAIFFRRGGRWSRVDVRPGRELVWDAPRPAFETAFLDTPGTSYDVTSDGRRLYFVEQVEPQAADRVGLLTDVFGRLP